MLSEEGAGEQGLDLFVDLNLTAEDPFSAGQKLFEDLDVFEDLDAWF